MNIFTEELKGLAWDTYGPIYDTLKKLEHVVRVVTINIYVSKDFCEKWKLQHITFALTFNMNSMQMEYFYKDQEIEPIIFGKTLHEIDILSILQAAISQDTCTPILKFGEDDVNMRLH